MPFDGKLFPASETLSAALQASGLDRLDLDLLARHKAAELNRNPPGWLYRHRTPVRLAYGLALIGGFICFAMLGAHGPAPSAIAAAAATSALILAALLVPMRGPARWVERPEQDLRSVHPAIRESALRLRGRLPDAEFRVGELFQNRVKLDPYLVADYRGARILLGIWDGETVILRA